MTDVLENYKVAFEADNPQRDRAQKMLGAKHLGKSYLEGALDEVETLRAERESLAERLENALKYDEVKGKIYDALSRDSRWLRDIQQLARYEPERRGWFVAERDLAELNMLTALLAPPAPPAAPAEKGEGK